MEPENKETRFNKRRFRDLYHESLEDVFHYWTPGMQDEIARHCYPWRNGTTDFKNYLSASERRYAIACDSLYGAGSFHTLCDIGGFFGVFPLTLARMGHRVAMTETLEYYSQSFTPLFDYLERNGVQIIDYDPFGNPQQTRQQFDVVTAMAIIEHYPHSLRGFMDNILRMLKADGRIYIEVPNIAYWPKRKALIFGKTPLVPISDIYHSSVPFIGHHHEFTHDELRNLTALSGLSVINTNQYNYSFHGPLIKRVCARPLLSAMSVIPSMRECLSVLAVRSQERRES